VAEGAAAALAAWITDPILVKSPEAPAKASGTAVKKEIASPHHSWRLDLWTLQDRSRDSTRA
jgi:hypothetical protein